MAKEILEKWYANLPLYTIDDNLENLKKLNTIKFERAEMQENVLQFSIWCLVNGRRMRKLNILQRRIMEHKQTISIRKTVAKQIKCRRSLTSASILERNNVCYGIVL